MKNTIEDLLLPVRARVQYQWNRETKKNERVCFVECGNGEILTGNVPFDWMHFICSCLNKKYINDSTKPYRVSNPIAVLRIEGLPLQKSESQIISTNKKGDMCIVESPDYTESINRAALLGEELFLERFTQLPISDPIVVSCIYNINGRGQYDLAQCNAWVLDMLNRLGIIHSKTNRTVKSTDGSRFRLIKESPFVMVIIRKVAEK